jgi:hypothetical protein
MNAAPYLKATQEHLITDDYSLCQNKNGISNLTSSITLLFPVFLKRENQHGLITAKNIVQGRPAIDTPDDIWTPPAHGTAKPKPFPFRPRRRRT